MFAGYEKPFNFDRKISQEVTREKNKTLLTKSSKVLPSGDTLNAGNPVKLKRYNLKESNSGQNSKNVLSQAPDPKLSYDDDQEPQVEHLS
jgi:hypothetical protein